MTDKLEILRHYSAIWKESMHVTIDKQFRDALDWAIAELEKRPAVPDKATGYPGYVPPEHGEAGAYYVEGWNDCREEMLNAQPCPAVPDGFRLVPVEPTPDMLCAGYWSGSGDVSVNEEWARREVYARMLNAAPQPPGGGEG